MKKILFSVILMTVMAALSACAGARIGFTATEGKAAAGITDIARGEKEKMSILIRVEGKELSAVLENNAATRALIKKLPMTVMMKDLYAREMCYRMGPGALPTENLRSDRYEVGDIIYWAPGGSLVILYEQNGEEFTRQQLGHIDKGVEFFKTTGDVNVTFEIKQ